METQDKLINFADLRRNNENIKKHFASASSLKLKANAAEVYTRKQVDDKLAAMSSGGEIDLSAYAKTEDVEKALQEVQTIKGDKGDQGEAGPQGPKGDDGAAGKDGKSAYELAVDNGFSGSEAEWLESLKGQAGEAGAQGEAGKDGKDGIDGKNGADGVDGKDGADGKSAYEIAVDNGFAGTEEEWLASLKGEGADTSMFYSKTEIDQKMAEAAAGGEVDLSAYAKTEDLEKAISEVQTIKGDKGDQGEVGPQGPKGEDGANGKDGIDGKNGVDGKDGVDGQDGKSAYDIAKENGFTGTEAEWVESLKGEKGDPGEIPNVENFVQKEDLNGYAKTEDIPDVSNLATKDDIPDVSNLATKDDIPDTSQFAKASDIPKTPTLAELGGVSQAGVESILQSKNFLSEDAIKELIKAAIAEAMKNSGGNSGGSTDPQPENPTPTTPDDPTPSEPVSDDDYAWTHYFVMPKSKNQITDNVKTFFHPGEEQKYSDFVGENYDMVNTTIEIRLIGSLRDNVNTACAMDDDIQGRTLATDVTKTWKDGIRVPFDFCDGEGTVDCAAYKAEISKFFMANNSELTYDCDEETGEMHFKTFTAACGFLYMVRKLKPGKVFPTYSMGEKIA
jgi:hypothetical protein